MDHVTTSVRHNGVDSLNGGDGLNGADRKFHLQRIATVPRTVLDPGKVGRTVGIVGLGYVGLPTALALAESGSTVIGYDVSPTRLSLIGTGAVDLLDKDHQRLRRHGGSDRFRLTADPAELAGMDTIIVCVPTPVDQHLVPDMGALSGACATAAQHAVPGQTIILTSTTYVGCTRDLLVRPLLDRGLRVGEDVFVAFSPERIDPGNAAHRHDETPRVTGGVTTACSRRAARALRRTTEHVHELSSPEAAELTKLVENSFRAVNIALANEFADVAGELNLDIVEVIDAAATKPYGFMPFYPGPGVGGHCIPCDPHYLLWQLRARRAHSPITEAAMTAIAGRPRRIAARAREVLAEAGRGIAGARVLVMGVTYKPGVADLRESPALEVIADLAASGATVAYADPYVNSLVAGGRELSTVRVPELLAWDLVVVHTVHPGVDHDWIAGTPAVLDASYGLPGIPHRELP